MCEKKLHKGFCGPRRSCVKSRKVLQVMSPESAGAEEYRFQNEGIWSGGGRNTDDLTRTL